MAAQQQDTLRALFQAEHMCFTEDAHSITCLAQHAGVAATVVRCDMDPECAEWVQCLHVRGCARTFAHLVEYIRAHLLGGDDDGITLNARIGSDVPHTPETDAVDLAVAHMRLRSEFGAWDGASAIARLLQPPGGEATALALAQPDALCMWKDLLNSAVLLPRDLDIAAQGALCFLGALQYRCTHHALFVPVLLRYVIPHIKGCLENRAVLLDTTTAAAAEEAAADCSLALREQGVLFLYAQLLLATELVARLLDDDV